ncbi:MAG: GIY-YIG nuclease family protein [Persicimonas sp.]
MPTPHHYIVVMRLAESTTIEVGAKGVFDFTPGYYLYVGRAKRALEARLKRHRRTDDKTLRWHVDYLRNECEWVEARLVDTPSECALAERLADLDGASRPVARFGASDCRCEGHLVYAAELPGELPGKTWATSAPP